MDVAGGSRSAGAHRWEGKCLRTIAQTPTRFSQPTHVVTCYLQPRPLPWYFINTQNTLFRQSTSLIPLCRSPTWFVCLLLQAQATISTDCIELNCASRGHSAPLASQNSPYIPLVLCKKSCVIHQAMSSSCVRQIL